MVGVVGAAETDDGLGGATGADPTARLPAASRPSEGATTIVFVIGVPSATRSATLDALGAEFGRAAVRNSIDVENGALPTSAIARLARADLVVALGREGCDAAASARAAGATVICTLLYRHAWRDVDCPGDCDSLLALLLDQPLPRQVVIARTFYPALQRFGVLSAEATAGGDDAITVRTPPEPGALAIAFEALAIENDAIVAVAEPGLYDADALRIALLSAYARGRPVIGFGPEYVRAGALLGVWSTPRDVFDQLSRLLDDPALWMADGAVAAAARTDLAARFGIDRTLATDRFHVERNVAVARSLGLSEGDVPRVGQRFTDGDFAR